MANHRPSDEKLLELITQPHFKRKIDTEPLSTNPITPTPMIVDVAQIDFYDRNPRQADNPEFENIKNGIRASKGLDWVLNITRRPGAEHYMLSAGGNTTLRAIKQLLVETGDPCFQQIHCLYIPWTGDDDVLLAHLQENDQRSGLIFIDRAKAVQDLRGLIEAETGESLSQGELAKQLQTRGYSINRRMIGWLAYAVDVLYKAIPFALKTGMGRPQVERLYNLERAFKAAWAVLDLDESEIDGLFTGVLIRHDCEYVDPDLVRNDLEAELMVSADCSLQRAQILLGMALDDGLNADEIRAELAKTPERVPFPGEDVSPHKAGGVPFPISREESTDTDKVSRIGQSTQRASAPGTSGKNVGANTPKPTVQPEPPQSSDANPLKDPPFGEFPNEDAGLTPSVTQGATLPDDIHALREQAFGLAYDIAMYMGAEDIVVSIDAGYGFLVGPMPGGGRGLTNAYSAAWGDKAWMVTDALWWMLATISEQFSAFGSAIPHMPPEWSDRPIGEGMRRSKQFPAWQMENYNQETVMDVPFTPVPQLGTHGFNMLHDEVWETWVDLVNITRRIFKISGGWE